MRKPEPGWSFILGKKDVPGMRSQEEEDEEEEGRTKGPAC
jgi:hypothetical protein